MRLALSAILLLALAPRAFADGPRTLVTVVTDDWKATTGELRRWRRDGATWQADGPPLPVVVGKSGLAWPADKREGDGASPAGRFALGDATGYDESPPAGTRLRYRQATSLLRCVDDPAAARYNQLVDYARTDRLDGRARDPDAVGSNEEMRRDDELYRFTVFVRHNAARVPGRGSCIFLHAWKDAATPTVGCTAMALDDLRALLPWLEPSTLLVQLPRDEYRRRQRAWRLPPLGQRK
jgi:L,D-peptidoglycan transpeptidase YkuD (ErfK/YbiS/YcfS/YnhG family)